MATELKKQDIQKQEIMEQDQAERTRECRLFVPRTDIFETNEAIYITADIPGVDQNSIEVTLEKNVLTINARVVYEKPVDYELTYAEYGVGDFHRRFSLNNEIDHQKIEAKVKNGVLNLILPKIGPARAKKISVKAE